MSDLSMTISLPSFIIICRSETATSLKPFSTGVSVLQFPKMGYCATVLACERLHNGEELGCGRRRSKLKEILNRLESKSLFPKGRKNIEEGTHR